MNRKPAGLLHINNEGWAEALTCSGLHLGGVYSERVDAGALSRPCTKPKVSCGMPELTIHYVSLPSWHLTEADTVHRLMKWKTYRPKIFMVCSGSQRAVSACELNSPLLIWFRLWCFVSGWKDYSSSIWWHTLDKHMIYRDLWYQNFEGAWTKTRRRDLAAQCQTWLKN